MNATMIYHKEEGTGYCLCFGLVEGKKCLKVRTPFNITGIQRATHYMESRGLKLIKPYQHGITVMPESNNNIDHHVI